MKFTSEIIRKAWTIRKEAAQKYGCPVMEISWKLSLKMAVEAGKETEMNNEIKVFIGKREIHDPYFKLYGTEGFRKIWGMLKEGESLIQYYPEGTNIERKIYKKTKGWLQIGTVQNGACSWAEGLSEAECLACLK